MARNERMNIAYKTRKGIFFKNTIENIKTVPNHSEVYDGLKYEVYKSRLLAHQYSPVAHSSDSTFSHKNWTCLFLTEGGKLFKYYFDCDGYKRIRLLTTSEGYDVFHNSMPSYHTISDKEFDKILGIKDA